MNNRVFGFVWFLISSFFALLPLWRGEAIHAFPAAVALLLATTAIAKPRLLAMPNRLWVRFGKKINIIASNVVLFLIYFLLFTPGAALLRLCGRNQLNLDFDSQACTYWVDRTSGDTNFTHPY